MSEPVIGNKNPLWSAGGPAGTPAAQQPAEAPAAAQQAPKAPQQAADEGAFNGANVLQAAAAGQWSTTGGLGSSQSSGGSWTSGWTWEATSTSGTNSNWSTIGTTGTSGQWTVDAVKEAAEKDLSDAIKAFDAMRASALKEVQVIREAATKLSFAQGGDVDGLAVGRQQRFENELKAAEQALLKTPPDVEAYRRDLADARTILNPPLNPKTPTGESRHQLFWGKPVPGSQDLLTKLNKLVDGAGFAGTKVTPTLFELRGNQIQAQSKVDTIRNAAEQRAKIASKAAEFSQAKVAAEEAQNRYQQAVFKVGGQFEDYFKNALKELNAMPATPEVAAAKAELLKVENALKLNYFGATTELLGKFEALAGAAGKPLAAPDSLRDSLKAAGKAQGEHHRAQDKAKRLDQEHQRMQAGYDEVFRR